MSRTLVTLLLIAIYVIISLVGVYYKLKMDDEKHPLDFFFGNIKLYRQYIGGHWYRVQLLDNKNDYHVALPIKKLWVRAEDMQYLKMLYYVVQENDF